MSELKNKTINSKAFPQGESFLEVILLRADMFFQHKFDVENTFVCDAHHKTLLRRGASSDSKKSDTCKSVREAASCAKTNLRYIVISQAITLFESFNLRNSYGKLICTKCRLEISNKTEIKRLDLQNDTFECLFDPKSVCCEEDSMEDKEIDYQPPFHASTGKEKRKEQIAALNSFISAFGSKRKINVTTSYQDLSHHVKLRYVSLIKLITRSATSLIASNDADMLMHDSFSDVNSEDLNIVLAGNFWSNNECYFGSIHQR